VRYYYYLFQALFEAQRRELSAHMQPSFRMSDLYAYRILVPTETEQRAMADFLDGETNKIGSLSGKAREMISILKERRQALISAAVTGKIDVRGLS
jgi:type I restriction enzyme S subunit